MGSRSRQDADDRPNVLLVVADTARAGEAYATDPVIMPTLRELGDAGTRFTNAFASAPWTLPSHAGIFTGAYSSKHGAHGAHPYLDEDQRTLAEAFAANGYETFGISNNTWISGEFGFDRGFERFWKGWQYIQSDDDVGAILHELGPGRRARSAVSSVFEGNPLVNAVNACYNHVYRSRRDYGAARSTERVENWVGQRDRERPFFCFLNYLEPHIKYQPPREFATPFLPHDATYTEAMAIRQDPRAYDVGAYDLSTRELGLLRSLYRGELAYVDGMLDRIRSALIEAGEWEDTLLIVAGDHGENIGDHGFFGHQYNVYDSLLHVPLVVTGGPFVDGGTRDGLVQLTDLVSTLLDLDGVEDEGLAEQTQGSSFHPDAGSYRDHVIAEYMAPQPPVETLAERYGELPSYARSFDRRLRTIRTATEKFVRGSDGQVEYYDVERDPAEQLDRADLDVDRVRALGDRLDDWIATFDHATPTDEVEITKATERRLADLGYR